MSQLRRDRALYLDLELTCWAGKPPEGQCHEIIEIGIVEVDTQTLQITREDGYYVRPEFSGVSEFCTDLTGITQGIIDKQGRYFHQVLASIKKKYGPTTKTCFAWGNDEEQIHLACDTCPDPSPFNFIDLGHLFLLQHGLTSAVSLENALKMHGLEFEGRPHSAKVDAHNLARLHMQLMANLRLGESS